jgi:periplasmic divalent cation tolerance protein
LVEERLAACVNVVTGVRSFYRWKGKIEKSPEWLLVIKSSRGRFEELRAALEKLHSYDVPEVIALPVVEGTKNYLHWMEGELGA